MAIMQNDLAEDVDNVSGDKSNFTVWRDDTVIYLTIFENTKGCLLWHSER